MKTQKRTYFTKSDLVSFGSYLLSKERERSLKANKTVAPYVDRFRDVTHADIVNWKETR